MRRVRRRVRLPQPAARERSGRRGLARRAAAQSDAGPGLWSYDDAGEGREPDLACSDGVFQFGIRVGERKPPIRFVDPADVNTEFGKEYSDITIDGNSVVFVQTPAEEPPVELGDTVTAVRTGISALCGDEEDLVRLCVIRNTVDGFPAGNAVDALRTVDSAFGENRTNASATGLSLRQPERVHAHANAVHATATAFSFTTSRGGNRFVSNVPLSSGAEGSSDYVTELAESDILLRV